MLLETLYKAFDELATKRKVFKVRSERIMSCARLRFYVRPAKS
jgi:hypothetical protein